MERKGFLIRSFSLEDVPENRDLLKATQGLAAKDGWTLSKIIREALTEYVKRHSPGNPQLGLVHWNSNTPMPQTVQERQSSKFELEIRQEKERGLQRWAKLQTWTNEELIARQAKLNDREGTYMERLEISMILMHRRLSSEHGSIPQTGT